MVRVVSFVLTVSSWLCHMISLAVFSYGYDATDRLEQYLLDKINAWVQHEVGHLYKD